MSNEEMFAVFYSEYPRRVARKIAEKAWSRLEMTEELFVVILDAVQVQKRTLWKGTAIEYVPYPATWLNQERWSDEIPTNGNGSHNVQAAREFLKGKLK